MFDVSDDEQDQLWIGVLGAGALTFGGAWFAPLLEPVRAWALQASLITETSLLVEMPGGVGLDLPRVLVVAGVLGLILAGVGFWAWRRIQTARERKRA